MTLGYGVLREKVMAARAYEGAVIHFMEDRKQRGQMLVTFLCILRNAQQHLKGGRISVAS